MVLLEKWKRDHTRLQNDKLMDMDVYVPQTRVKSHSLAIRRDVQGQDYNNINQLIMK